MNIKQMALEKALAFLKASGADFVVVLDGKTYQSEGMVPPLEDPPPARTRRKLHNFAFDTDYIPKLSAMQTGDVVVFERKSYKILETKLAWDNFLSSVHSKSRALFGSGNFLYRADHEQNLVEIMRVG